MTQEVKSKKIKKQQAKRPKSIKREKGYCFKNKLTRDLKVVMSPELTTSLGNLFQTFIVDGKKQREN